MIPINEIFGPTIQGEGPHIGEPCAFIRLHGCPVHCPGCDTYFTWDGSEKPSKLTVDDVLEQVAKLVPKSNGIILSGGEPLLYHNKRWLLDLLEELNSTYAWVDLETSGYTTKKVAVPELLHFTSYFRHISLSPKVTPCLHGRQSYEDLTTWVPTIIRCHQKSTQVSVKLVARDAEDIEAVDKFVSDFLVPGVRVFVMPYGLTADEVTECGKYLVGVCSDKNYILTPRLHTIYWGTKRGV